MFPFRTTEVNGLTIAYREKGQGDQHLLFVHGWASSSRMWNEALRVFADEYHCWAIDLVGFGDSEKPTNGRYTVDNWAAQIAGFAAQMEISTPVVIGHSMGGAIALQLAIVQPEIAAGIALINPVVRGKIYGPMSKMAKTRLGSTFGRLGAWMWPVMVSPALANPFGIRSRKSPHFERIREDWARVRGDTAMETIRTVVTHDPSAALPSIATPTLVVLGDRDSTAPNSEGRFVAETVQHAELVVFKSGHLPTDDAPAETHSALRNFAHHLFLVKE